MRKALFLVAFLGIQTTVCHAQATLPGDATENQSEKPTVRPGIEGGTGPYVEFPEFAKRTSEITSVVLAVIGVILAIAVLAGAMKAGILRRIRFGAFELEAATPKQREEAKAFVAALTDTPKEQVPFETAQLALYYGQILGQSKISFWFSLIFASLGFLVIVVAVFLYAASSNVGATVAQLIAGIIIDAVAALFFAQSRSAQNSMAEFFDKLRTDRRDLESRTLCEAIEDPKSRDLLRINLSLHYARVEHVPETCKMIIEAYGRASDAVAVKPS